MLKNKHTLIVTFSGIDGAGKSTQISSLNKYFLDNGFEPLCIWTRGGYTPGINWVKKFSRKLAGKKLPPSGNSVQREQMFGKGWIKRLWLTVAILDLLWIYSIRMRWWLWQGKIVICDRYIWDTLIDFKIMFPGLSVEKLFLWKLLVCCTPKPNLQCLLMIPLELSEKRCAQKYEPFPDTLERRKRRYALYEKVGKWDNWIVLDATRPVKMVFEDIRSFLS